MGISHPWGCMVQVLASASLTELRALEACHGVTPQEAQAALLGRSRWVFSQETHAPPALGPASCSLSGGRGIWATAESLVLG